MQVIISRSQRLQRPENGKPQRLKKSIIKSSLSVQRQLDLEVSLFPRLFLSHQYQRVSRSASGLERQT